MKTEKIIVKSISDLLCLPDLKDRDDVFIIFVTDKEDYYYFGWTSFYHLKIKDDDGKSLTEDKAKDFIDYVGAVKQMIEDSPLEQHYIYVCCDAGLSRSPAVAKFVAEYLEQEKWVKYITETHKFLSEAIYKVLVKNVKEC